MPNNTTTEKLILGYLGGPFKSHVNYDLQRDALIRHLLKTRGQKGAINAVASLRKVVLQRIYDQIPRPNGYNHSDHHAFNAWLKDLNKRLGPNVTQKQSKASKKAQAKIISRRIEAQRSRNKIGYIAMEKQAYDARLQ